jgi:hypothetical protein
VLESSEVASRQIQGICIKLRGEAKSGPIDGRVELLYTSKRKIHCETIVFRRRSREDEVAF